MRKIYLEVAGVVTLATAFILIYGALGVTSNNGAIKADVISISLDELKAMVRTFEYAKLECVGNPVAEGNWTGVKFGLLLQKVPNQNVQVIELRASDGYSRTLTSSEASREDVIIAYLLNGNPLQEKTRLVVPYRNGDQWISDIVEIRVTDVSGGYSIIYLNTG